MKLMDDRDSVRGGVRAGGSVTRLVGRARRRMRVAATLAAACRWVVMGLGVWLGLFALDNLLALPAGLRLPLALAGGALLVGVLVRQVVLPALKGLRPERVAVLLEARYGIRDNLLINAYQFERRNFGESEGIFADDTVARCEAAVGGLNMAELWDVRRRWPWAVGAVIVLTAWAGYAWLCPGFVVNAGQRFAMPLAEIPPPGAPVIVVKPSGRVAIAEGDSIEVKAEVIDRRPVGASRDEAPTIVWIENAASVPAVRGQGEEAAMVSAKGRGGVWSHSFVGIRRPFAFRVFGAGTQSAVVSVQVHPLPKIAASLFRVVPPEYTGLEPVVSAGPPSSVAALAGSRLEVELAVEPAPGGVRWRDPSGMVDMALRDGKWRAGRVVGGAAQYEVEARVAGLNRDVLIARSQMQVSPDAPPEVDFVGKDRNRFAFPGTVVPLPVRARDDLGLKAVWITARATEGEGSSRTEVRRWGYLGPPGRRGEVTENGGLAIDPSRFRVGEAYLVEAWAADFNPSGKPVSSRPILVRVRSPMESDLERRDPLVKAFERLKQAVAAQERAIGLAGNLRGHLEEAVAKQDLHEHRRAIGEAQGAGLQAGAEALDGFRSSEEGRGYAGALAPLIEGEIPWVVGDIERLNLAEVREAPEVVGAILRRQTHVRDEMMALLGRIAEDRKSKGADAKAREGEKRSREEVARDLKAELDTFLREQAKVVERGKDFAGKAAEALGQGEREAVGELARKEAGLAGDIKKKATELAGQGDPSDESVRAELERVAEDARAASDALYKKDAAQALPPAQSSLEAAARLAQALEKQLAGDEGTEKQEGKSPGAPAPVEPLAAEMEDAVRGLLGEQAAMSGEIEKVARKLVDSSARRGEPKGAGAGTDEKVDDRPLPGDMEVGGSAVAGPAGRSAGKMTGQSAEGVGPGTSAPRISMTPFEDGKVKDGEAKDAGGGTGGGKLAGFSGVGLRGQPPPPAPDSDAPRLAEQQGGIRQRAEQLAMRLRAQRVATGDLENSVAAMRQVERDLLAGDGFGVQSAYSQALDALGQSRETMRAMAGVLRERTQMSPRVRDEITSGLRDGVPRGYDEMSSAYFRALAEGETGGAPEGATPGAGGDR